MRFLAIVLIVAAALWRILAIHAPELANFSPVMALAFCGGVYFKPGWMWLVPFLALGVSDLYIDRVYAAEFNYHLSASTEVARLASFAIGIVIGSGAFRQRSWLRLLGGILGSSVFFYLLTNTASWYGDDGYAHNLGGWWQAMTIGHPQFAPTIFFFRNTFLSDVAFTGLFVGLMEFAALRNGQPNLLRGSRPQA